MLPTAVTATWKLFQEGSQFDQFWQNQRNYFSTEKKHWEQHQENIPDTGLESTWKNTQPLNILLYQTGDIHTMLALWGSFWFSCSLVLRTERPLVLEYTSG